REGRKHFVPVLRQPVPEGQPNDLERGEFGRVGFPLYGSKNLVLAKPQDRDELPKPSTERVPSVPEASRINPSHSSVVGRVVQWETADDCWVALEPPEYLSPLGRLERDVHPRGADFREQAGHAVRVQPDDAEVGEVLSREQVREPVPREHPCRLAEGGLCG